MDSVSSKNTPTVAALSWHHRAMISRTAIPALAVLACIVFGSWLFSHALRTRVVIDGVRYVILGDDMLISLRYAYQLAQGHGLVWNAGERVLGITNLGWTLLAAIPYALGASLVVGPFIVKSANIALHAGLVTWLFLWCRHQGRMLQGIVTGLLIAFNAPLMVWGLLGFETTCQAVLITAACLPLFGHGSLRWAVLWAALAAVTRPDGLLVVAMLFAVVLVLEPSRRLVLPALVSCGVLLAVFLGQWHYYGSWLPNTYVLKATGGANTLGRGIAYLGEWVWGESLALPLVVAPLAYLLWRRTTSLRVVAAAGIAYLWIAYVVWIGGDAFPHARFFIAIETLLALFVGALVDELAREAWFRRDRLRRAVLATILLTLLLVGLAAHVNRAWPILQAAQQPLSPAVSATCVGLAIKGMALPPDTVIGVYWAGIIPYLLPGYRFHDFLGKSDPFISHVPARAGPPGHNKWDYAYSLGVVRPALIVTAGGFDGANDLEYAARVEQAYGFHAALWLDPVFRAEYRAHRLWPPPGNTEWPFQWVYARGDFRSPRPFQIPTGACRGIP